MGAHCRRERQERACWRICWYGLVSGIRRDGITGGVCVCVCVCVCVHTRVSGSGSRSVCVCGSVCAFYQHVEGILRE